MVDRSMLITPKTNINVFKTRDTERCVRCIAHVWLYCEQVKFFKIDLIIIVLYVDEKYS